MMLDFILIHLLGCRKPTRSNTALSNSQYRTRNWSAAIYGCPTLQIKSYSTYVLDSIGAENWQPWL